MIVKGMKNTLLWPLLLLILMGNGGCMGMAHHTPRDAEPAFVPSATVENPASVEGPGARDRQVARKPERAGSSFFAPHQAMMGHASRWGWLAGAGMMLMMVVIIL